MLLARSLTHKETINLSTISPPELGHPSLFNQTRTFKADPRTKFTPSSCGYGLVCNLGVAWAGNCQVSPDMLQEKRPVRFSSPEVEHFARGKCRIEVYFMMCGTVMFDEEGDPCRAS